MARGSIVARAELAVKWNLRAGSRPATRGRTPCRACCRASDRIHRRARRRRCRADRGWGCRRSCQVVGTPSRSASCAVSKALTKRSSPAKSVSNAPGVVGKSAASCWPATNGVTLPVDRDRRRAVVAAAAEEGRVDQLGAIRAEPRQEGVEPRRRAVEARVERARRRGEAGRVRPAATYALPVPSTATSVPPSRLKATHEGRVDEARARRVQLGHEDIDRPPVLIEGARRRREVPRVGAAGDIGASLAVDGDRVGAFVRVAAPEVGRIQERRPRGAQFRHEAVAAVRRRGVERAGGRGKVARGCPAGNVCVPRLVQRDADPTLQLGATQERRVHERRPGCVQLRHERVGNGGTRTGSRVDAPLKVGIEGAGCRGEVGRIGLPVTTASPAELRLMPTPCRCQAHRGTWSTRAESRRRSASSRTRRRSR